MDIERRQGVVAREFHEFRLVAGASALGRIDQSNRIVSKSRFDLERYRDEVDAPDVYDAINILESWEDDNLSFADVWSQEIVQGMSMDFGSGIQGVDSDFDDGEYKLVQQGVVLSNATALLGHKEVDRERRNIVQAFIDASSSSIWKDDDVSFIRIKSIAAYLGDCFESLGKDI